MLKILWVGVSHFLGPKRSKEMTPTNGPEFGPDFGTKHVPKHVPKMNSKMALKRLLGEILASSKPSWVVLGLQQAFFESSGSTMIANSLSRGRFEGFLGSFKVLQGPFLKFFGSIQGILLATWTFYGVCWSFLVFFFRA